MCLGSYRAKSVRAPALPTPSRLACERVCVRGRESTSRPCVARNYIPLLSNYIPILSTHVYVCTYSPFFKLCPTFIDARFRLVVVMNKIEQNKTPLDNVSISDGSLFLGCHLSFPKLYDGQLFPSPARYRCQFRLQGLVL